MAVKGRCFTMYNKQKLDELAEKMRKQTEKYNIPTMPKKKNKKKKPSGQ